MSKAKIMEITLSANESSDQLVISVRIKGARNRPRYRLGTGRIGSSVGQRHRTTAKRYA